MKIAYVELKNSFFCSSSFRVSVENKHIPLESKENYHHQIKGTIIFKI